ncbi:hypothetical protein BC940DRAFT_334013 [Gongronella butleri]|nr:hypothetical protein BC940DRAFT_334013 [Gongronella butleri]
MEKYEGDHLAAHYLAELQAMWCVPDSVAFGSMLLLEKLDYCFDRLTAQVRTVHAIPPSNRREEALTVAFIADRAPRLFSEKWDPHARHNQNQGHITNGQQSRTTRRRSPYDARNHRGNRGRSINTRLSSCDDGRQGHYNNGRQQRENRHGNRADSDIIIVNQAQLTA